MALGFLDDEKTPCFSPLDQNMYVDQILFNYALFFNKPIYLYLEI